MPLKIYINGEFFNKDDARSASTDHACSYGEGVFEGIRSYKRQGYSG